MSGIINDVSTVFSNVGDTIAGWFGGGAGSDAANAALASSADAMSSAAGDAAQQAAESAAGSAASDFLSSSAGAASSGMSDAISNMAGAAETAGSGISNLFQNMDTAAAASYTAGVTTSDWAISPSDTSLNINPSDAIGLKSPYTSAAVGLGDPNQTSWFGRMANGFKNMFGGGDATPGSASSTNSLLMGEMLGRLGGAAISAWGAYKMNQPRAPANFSGRTPGGGGAGLGMHTVNGGFGLGAGGTETPPSGVPSQLVPNAQAEQLGGSGGLSHAAPPPVAGAPNLQQTVANQAGVGGLIPQGAVNFMKGQSNG